MLMLILIEGVAMICFFFNKIEFNFFFLRIGEVNLAITDYSSALDIENEL